MRLVFLFFMAFLPIKAIPSPKMEVSIEYWKDVNSRSTVYVLLKNNTESEMLVKRHRFCLLGEDVFKVYGADERRVPVNAFFNFGVQYIEDHESLQYHVSISPGGAVGCVYDLGDLYDIKSSDGQISVQLVLDDNVLVKDNLLCSLSSNVITIDLEAGVLVNGVINASNMFNDQAVTCRILGYSQG